MAEEKKVSRAIATPDQIREAGLNLQVKMAAFNTAVGAINTAMAAMDFKGADGTLPTQAALKTQLTVFNNSAKPAFVMQSWMQIVDFLQKIGILPIIILLLAIPGGFLLTLIGAKRYLFSGIGTTVRQAFVTWMDEQKERTKIEVKLEERLSDLTDQLKQLVAGQWDTRRYVDTIFDEVRNEHRDIIAKLDNLINIIPKRKADSQ